MGVPIVHTLAGEVLAGGHHIAFFLHTFHVSAGHSCHPGRMVGDGANIGLRVVGVHVEVNHRRKGPVNAVFTADLGGILTGFFNQFCIVASAPGHTVGEHPLTGQLHTGAVLNIAGNDHGDGGVAVGNGQELFDALSGVTVQENAAGFSFLAIFFKLLRCDTVGNVDTHQLTDQLVQG